MIISEASPMKKNTEGDKKIEGRPTATSDRQRKVRGKTGAEDSPIIGKKKIETTNEEEVMGWKTSYISKLREGYLWDWPLRETDENQYEFAIGRRGGEAGKRDEDPSQRKNKRKQKRENHQEQKRRCPKKTLLPKRENDPSIGAWAEED